MTQSSEGDAAGILAIERVGQVVTVTLNRPERRNALSAALVEELREVLAALDAAPDVAAIILTGTDPAFCAGGDLKETKETGKPLSSTVMGPGSPVGSPWEPVMTPMIAAVNGVAITGGLELALNCDFIIASEQAVFADTHTRVGSLPGWGLSVLLPQRVGFAFARQMSLTGNFVDAQTALRAGLVTELVPHEQLMSRARELADAIASNNAAANRALLASYRRIEREVLGNALNLEAEAFRRWRAAGGTAKAAERVDGVLARGRGQISPAGS